MKDKLPDQATQEAWLAEARQRRDAALAQSAEHLPCKQEVAGSTPAGSAAEPFSEDWCKLSLQEKLEAIEKHNGPDQVKVKSLSDICKLHHVLSEVVKNMPKLEDKSGSRSSVGLEHGASTSKVTGSSPVETTKPLFNKE